MSKSTRKEIKIKSSESSFWRFVVAREQVVDWVVVLLAALIPFCGIRLIYPYVGIYSDSMTYVKAAADDTFLPFRPFGYSAYLQWVHHFSDSINAVAWSQLLLYVVCMGVLVMALKRCFGLCRGWVRVVMEVVMTASPMALYMLNYVMSDSLFCCLTFVMVAMLIVAIKEESYVALVVYAVALTASLLTRYSALFLPIAAVPLMLWVKNKRLRYVALALTAVSIFTYYTNVSDNMRRVTGKKQLATAFGGWQMANNGMHVLPYITDYSVMPDDEALRGLHQFCIRRYDDKIRQVTEDGRKSGTFFMWEGEMPLKQYMYYLMSQNPGLTYIDAWTYLGSGVYQKYGSWLMRQYPWLFVRYYLWPSAPAIFYTDNLELLKGQGVVDEKNKAELGQWYSDVSAETDMSPMSQGYTRYLSPLIPWIEVATWLALALALTWLIVEIKRGRVSLTYGEKLMLALLLAVILVYYSTSTFATPTVIRYWMPMHALKLSVVWLALSRKKSNFAE